METYILSNYHTFKPFVSLPEPKHGLIKLLKLTGGVLYGEQSKPDEHIA
jgi:hypothetical protein